MRVYVSVYHAGSRTTPLTPEARTAFASYVAAIARDVPQIRDVIVGNEPNLNRFWMPQFALDGGNAAAPAYLQLLAETYDALEARIGTLTAGREWFKPWRTISGAKGDSPASPRPKSTLSGSASRW